jgi:DNA modification methylase
MGGTSTNDEGRNAHACAISAPDGGALIDVSISGHYVGDCRELLDRLPDGCVQTCVTSPPYWSLRSYFPDDDPRAEKQIGLEATPEDYVREIVAVFSKVRRVLRDDGTCWINLGDCYASSGRGGAQGNSGTLSDRSIKSARIVRRTGSVGSRSTLQGSTDAHEETRRARGSLKPAGFHEYVRQYGGVGRAYIPPPSGTKNKDLLGLPWMVAFALRADGWYLRADIIWHKPNPLPESVTDRPTKSHEYIFLLSKSETYFYDADAIREPLKPKTLTTFGTERRCLGNDALGGVKADNWSRDVRLRRAKTDDEGNPVGANKRSVWTVGTQPYDGAHFATFPPRLIEPCILAGSRVGDLVLDPFFGSGTVGLVAEKHGRRWVGFDLGYEDLAKERTAQRSLPIGGGA